MKKQTVCRIIFALYLCVMVYLMFLQRIGTEHAHTVPHYNLIPLEGIRIFAENLLGDDPYWVRHAVINLVGNVVMFVPAGFLVPRISGRLSTLVRVLAVCFGALMCAEALQLISLLGSFDVDDIILNMAGVLIGFGLHKACTKTKKGRSVMKTKGLSQDSRRMAVIIMALAWPTMLEQLLQTAVQYIDTAMVGSLGTQATAAVGSTTTVGWVIQFTVSALGVGFLALISQRRGAGDFDGAREVAAQAVLAVLAVGSIFTAAPLLLHKQIPVWMQVDESIRELAGQYFFILYVPMLLRTASLIFGTVLRAAGDTKTPMKVGLTVNIVNVVLNFLLIYPTRRVTLFGLSILLPGADLGVLGAAGASAAAFALGGVYTTVKLLRHRDISPLGHSLRPNKKILIPCIKIALPNMLQKFGTSMGYATFSSMINALGEAATAAHTIANTVESAFYIPGYGMQTAAATLAGNAIGARDKAALKKLARVFIPIEVGLMAISGLILFVSAPALVGLFSTSATVIALGSTVLRIVAVSEPFYGFSIIIDGMMHGGGLTTKPFIYNICGMWGIRIVGTFICTTVLNFGFVSCWVCMVANNMAIFALYLCDYIRGKWYPKSLDTQG